MYSLYLASPSDDIIGCVNCHPQSLWQVISFSDWINYIQCEEDHSYNIKSRKHDKCFQLTILIHFFQIKCEERSRYAAKVDRINQLGKDLAGEIDQPSHDAIQEELQPFNARWSDVSSQLENFSDKGYPQPGSECCLLRIMRRKFGVFQ